MPKAVVSVLATGLQLGALIVAPYAYFAVDSLVGTSSLISTASIAGYLGLGPSQPKPDTTLTALKTARPPRVSAYGVCRLYFSYALYETASDGTAVDVGAVHDGKMNALVKLYLNDDPVTLTGNVVNAGEDKRYRDNVLRLYWTDGSDVGTPFAPLITLLPGIWTNNHRGDGVVMLAQTAKPVKSKRFLETYPNQVPVPSMVAQWQLCPDPHSPDPTNRALWTWTENGVRHLMHYKMVRENVDYASKIAPTLSYWQAAADVCDSARALKTGGTEALYRSCLSHKHTDTHAAVNAALISTFDGWIAPRADGALVVYAGKYYAPTVSIGPAQIVAYDWNGVGVDDDKAINEIICSYVSAEHDYNTVETDAWRDENDIAKRGAVLSTSLDPQVPSWAQVRYLAKRRMDRANTLYRGTVTTNIAGRAIRGERFINLHLEEAGTVFYSGPVEIVSVTRSMQGGVTFSWIAANPDIDLWNPITEEGEPAAKGDRVAAQPLDAPVIDTAVAALAPDGLTATIVLDVDAPDREDLTWFVHWRVQGAATWGGDLEYPDADPGAAVTLVTDTVPTNAMIEVEAAYQIGDGRVSPWSATETVNTSTSALAPPPPTGFAVTGGAGQASAVWTNPTAPNFVDVQFFRNTTNNFGTAVLVTTLAQPLGGAGSYTNTGLSAGTYYFWIRSRSASGSASAAVASGAKTVT